MFQQLKYQKNGKLLTAKDYFINRDGVIVYKNRKGELVKSSTHPHQKKGIGYEKAQIYGGKKGERKRIKHEYVHRLVINSFQNKVIPKGMQVDHFNKNPKDNSLKNLRVVTPKENCKRKKSTPAGIKKTNKKRVKKGFEPILIKEVA